MHTDKYVNMHAYTNAYAHVHIQVRADARSSTL